MMQLVLRLQTLADSDEDAIAQARLAGRICRHPMRIPQTVRELRYIILYHIHIHIFSVHFSQIGSYVTLKCEILQVLNMETTET